MTAAWKCHAPEKQYSAGLAPTFMFAVMATRRLASIVLLCISVMLLSIEIAAAQSRPASRGIDRDAVDEHRLLRTSRWPILTVAYQISGKRIERHRQLLDQDSFLAHRQFDRGGH
jgi:hypothetical protein